MSGTAAAQTYQLVYSAVCNKTLGSVFQTGPKLALVPS